MSRENESFVQKHAIRMVPLPLVVLGILGADAFEPKGIWPSQYSICISPEISAACPAKAAPQGTRTCKQAVEWVHQ
jgi:hypothetical protein